MSGGSIQETKMRKILAVGLLLMAAAPLAGCYVYAPGPVPYSGAYWVPGHYGPYGGWIRGHWA
jgi:hypothetical protein